MSTIPHITLTDQGQTMMRRALDEGPMTFTRMAMGDGRPAGAIPGLTAMGRERLTVQITKSDRSGNTLTLFGEITGVSEAFPWLELGLFARIAGEGEQLVGYLDLGDAGEVVAPDDGVERAIYVTLAVLDGAEVTVTLGPRERIDWEQINDPPATYPPSQHTHPWAEITDPPATFLTGHGAPGVDVIGPVGMRYLDLDTNAQYVCVSHDAEGYHWVPPHLLGSSGQITGDLSVGGVFSVKDYLVVGPDRVYVTRRLMGKDMTLDGQAKVEGSLTVGKTAEILSDLTVGRPDEGDGPKGNLTVHGAAELHKASVDSSLDVGSSLSVGSTATFGGKLVPVVAEDSNVGDEANRFRTAFVKKVDASEHVATPKLRPPTGLDYIKFMCESAAPPGASPNPLPIEWGGTGTTYGAPGIDNRLYNWFFPRPINQRGVSGTITQPGYFIDRWKLVSGSVTLGGNGITLNGTISQVMEIGPGAGLVATALTTTGILTGSYTASTGTVSFTASGKTLIAAKLGETQIRATGSGSLWTLLEPRPDPALELARCQRYYLRMVYTERGVMLADQNSRGVAFYIPTPVTMRTNPAFHLSGAVTLPSDIDVDVTGSAKLGKNGVYFYVTDYNGDDESAGKLYAASFPYGPAYLELNAEL